MASRFFGGREGPWFAWRPVRLREQGWVWLRWVYRIPRYTEYADTRYGPANPSRRRLKGIEDSHDG